MASGVNRTGNATMLSIGEVKFESSKLASFFEDLRSVGMEGRYKLPKRETQRQYVICGVFSRDEIMSSEKYKSHIDRFTEYVLSLYKKDDWTFGSKFICNGRFAVLLNNLGRHGEARLFDPDGSLLRELGITRTADNAEDNVTEKRYLDEMKQRFAKSGGKWVEPYIVLLSHLIPCTEPGHECARLIRDYVERTKDKIIVSYDCGWQGTDRKRSLELLTHDNISVVAPSLRREQTNIDVGKLVAESTSRSSILKRVSSREEDLLEEADLMEVSPRKRKPTKKWPTVEKPGRDVGSKKKRRSFSRQTSE